MKKLILLAAALLISSYGFAQQFGVKAGLNVTNITNDDEAKYKPTIHAGIFVEFALVDWLSFQPELVYSRQGAKGKFLEADVWIRTDYINLPLIFKFHLTEKFTFDFGPQFGFMVTGKTKLKSGSSSVDVDIEEKNDFDASLGMGMSYKLTRHLDLIGRYNLGLTNVLDVGEKNKHSVIQLGLGYRF